MRLNKIALALVAATVAPMMANAGVTVTPVLLGYHVAEDIEDTADKQRDVLRTGKDLYYNAEGQALDGRNDRSHPRNGGVAQESGLYTGAALGIELTPSSQFQIEYGVSSTNGEASEKSAEAGVNRFDYEQETISGNFLIGTDQFSGYSNNALRPYVLIGAGQSKVEVENQESYEAEYPVAGYAIGDTVPAGTQVDSTKDTIGNLGLGATYRINDALSLRGEARAIHNFDNNWWEGMALGGLEVVLGGHLTPPVAVAPLMPVEPVRPVRPVEEVTVIAPVPPQPIPVPVPVPQPATDTDGDGVIDRLDQCPNTERNLVVDAVGCPIPLDMIEDLRMELRVFFDNDESVIKEQYTPEIAKVAEKMREYPNATAQIEGHASKTGPSAIYNQRLSEARAVAVKSMLTNEFGVAPNRLTTVGYGYTRPIAPNDTEEGRAMNRRVYAIITGNKTMTVNQTRDMQVQ